MFSTSPTAGNQKEKMVAVKFLGLIVTFYLFVVLEAFGQNFYPARYGKRDDNDSYQASRRIGRSENQDTINRKMGFFVSGGRFGKRRCTENCYEGSKEIISSGYQNRQDRSERIRIPIRKNQFMMGSRFGKRMEEQIGVPDFVETASAPNVKCIFTEMGDLYKCLERKQLSDEANSFETNSNDEFIQ